MKCNVIQKIKLLLLSFAGVLAFVGAAKAQAYQESFEDFANLGDWYVQNNSDSIVSATYTIPWSFTNQTTPFAAYHGTNFMVVSYESSNSNVPATLSNWLVTPQRTFNNGDEFKFYTRTNTGNFADRLEVRLGAGALPSPGTGSASVGDYSTLLLTINPTLTTTGYPTTWTEYTITISGLSGPTVGRIAFRYYVTNGGPAGGNSEGIGLDYITYTPNPSASTPPANNECAGAIQLTPSSTCVEVSGTTANATQSLVGCTGNANDDVWYKFTATQATTTLKVQGSSGFDPVVEIFEGAACGSLVSTPVCINGSGAGSAEHGNITGLTVGQTYHIRVYDYGVAPTTNTFTICVYNPSVISNDECTGAITLTPSTACTPVTGTTANATQSMTGCSGNANDDVWYKFTATNDIHPLEVQGSSGFDAVIEVFEGTCASLTPYYSCIDQTGVGAMEHGNMVNLTVGQTYYMRIYDYGTSPATNTFTVCIEEPSNPTVCDITQPAGSTLEAEVCGGTETNGPCDVILPGAQFLSCGETVFGKVWTSSTQRDLDFYVFTLDAPGTVTWKANAEFPFDIAFVDLTDCIGNVAIEQRLNNPACQETSVSHTFTQAGTYYVVIAPIAQMGPVCNNNNEYYATLTMPSTPAVVTYPSTTICKGSANALPTVSGPGTFSATPAGLVFADNFTGEIDATTSAAGTYTITFTPSGACKSPVTRTITIVEGVAVSFNYPTTSICVSGQNITPVKTGTGTFTASPAGLVFINTSTGQINAAASTPGIYTITFTPTGSCGGNPVSQSITISAGDASFSYQSATVCSSGSNVIPTSAEVGTFSATPSGLIFADNSTGEINVAASAPGTYTITHTTTGSCSATANQTITILNSNPSFSYPSSTVCEGSANVTPVAVTPGGSYSATAGLVINTTTGQIDVASSTAGTHQITYTTTGTCSSSATQNFTIASSFEAAFSYSSASFCSGSTNQQPVFTGNNTAGTFAASPAGLIINNATGIVDLTNSAPGIYVVTNTIPASGSCTSTSATTQLIVLAKPTATISGGGIICETGTVPVTITFTGSAPFNFAYTNGTTPVTIMNHPSATYTIDAYVTGTYTVGSVSDANCVNSGSGSAIVTLEQKPVVTIAALESVCEYNPAFTLTGGSPAGGEYSVNGVNSADFDPAAAGTGVHTITYTYTNASGCSNDAATTITVDECLSVDKVGLFTNLSVYPNPSTTDVTVEFTTSYMTDVHLSVLSPDGKMINERSFAQQNDLKYKIDVSGYAQGVYMINIRTSEGTVTKKFTVQ